MAEVMTFLRFFVLKMRCMRIEESDCGMIELRPRGFASPFQGLSLMGSLTQGVALGFLAAPFQGSNYDVNSSKILFIRLPQMHSTCEIGQHQILIPMP